MPKLTAHALLPVAMLALASCTTEPKYAPAPAVTSLTAVQPGVAGGTKVNTYKETAIVKAIDHVTRKVTLVTADGNTTTVKAGPDVANFAQIEVGDHVKATVTEELVIFVRRAGERSSDGGASVVALSPIGDKPGVVMANTEDITAQVKSMDVKNRKATLLFPDGHTHTFNVRPDVEMTNYREGDKVVFRTTEAVAISVEKP